MIEARELFPLSSNGGVTLAVENEPGAVRPFAAMIASTLVPVAYKHSRPATQRTYTTTQQTSMDGKQQTDSHNDTQND
jgi:hypothetical protein